MGGWLRAQRHRRPRPGGGLIPGGGPVPPSAATLRAWRRTRYEAGGASCRPGRRSPGLDTVLSLLAAGPDGAPGADDPAALSRRRLRGGFITAWNPLGRRRPDGWNWRRQAVLAQALGRMPRCAGQGIGQGWREAHFLVVGDPRRLAVLGRRFRQLGWLEVRVGQPPRLRLLWGRARG